MDLQKNIVGITLGIRYAKSFRIPDIAGEIVDTILYNSESPFSPQFFPQIQESSSRERTLFNPETTDYLRINTDDLIIGITVNDDFEEKFTWLKDEVLKFLMDKLFVKYEIKNVKRLGVIFDHKISKPKEIEKAISILTKDNIKSIENVNFSFSQKIAATESLYRKGVNDYKNTIYSFFEKSDSFLARLDYQYYYEPVIEDLREAFVDKILNDSQSFLTGNYYKWLSDKEKDEK